MTLLSKLISSGNRKLPTTTAIFNMGSATDCPSLKLGLCTVVNEGIRCYAKKAEYGHWPEVLPRRREQEKFWKSTSALEFVNQFLSINKAKRKPFTAIRLNEAGDFWSQDCIEKADIIARELAKHGVVCYCYTSRSDLDYSNVKHLVVHGSGFRKTGITSEFKMVENVKTDRPKGYAICPMSCKICNRCHKRGVLTVVPRH